MTLHFWLKNLTEVALMIYIGNANDAYAFRAEVIKYGLEPFNRLSGPTQNQMLRDYAKIISPSNVQGA